MSGIRGAVVFDCDGLLLDTAAAWFAAFRAGAQALDQELSDRQFASLTGASVGAAAARIALWAGETGETGRVAKMLDEALRTAVEHRPPAALPGAVELVSALSGRVPLGVASNAPAGVLTEVLRGAGLWPAFGTVVSADDVAAPKPAPDVYRAACRRLGADPGGAVALEDSAAGATAAQAAGMALVVVTNSGWPGRTPLRWPGTGRPVLYVRALDDPAVLPHLLHG
ncbi:HAD family phosphatase [Amycolatopsis endophytica]|uniref:HAD superfamily hydrolase (TIGR01509 family) n=1 Tax=Amycolatopsis endophytica TaxID=860233 RepID=A0A853BE93_9PSEU|nr:HAD family phosphatase [Amycolatopsis endophytica]NYI93350.1 HAD superfamily hydrolase (TIGR01509 family) [Amycolatopsis endophytica]